MATNYPGEGTMQPARSPAPPIKHLQMASRARGFTLVELMVTVAVAAILMAIATPSFTSIINSNRLTSAANEMVATLQTARMEAVRLNTTVKVCSGCDGNAGSVVAYVDANNNNVATAAEILRISTFNPNVRRSGGVNLVFRADGFGRTAAAPNGALAATSFSFCIPTTKPAENVRVVSIGSGSRISTDPVDGGGKCP
jgi:type IV fimbrial biogenesis protein FimT